MQIESKIEKQKGCIFYICNCFFIIKKIYFSNKKKDSEIEEKKDINEKKMKKILIKIDNFIKVIEETSNIELVDTKFADYYSKIRKSKTTDSKYEIENKMLKKTREDQLFILRIF